MKQSTYYFELIKPFLTFKMERAVEIVDWKLGLTKLIGTLLCLVYGGMQIIQLQKYLEVQTPYGVITPYVAGESAAYKTSYRAYTAQAVEELAAAKEDPANPLHDMCYTDTFDYVYPDGSGEFVYQDFQCKVDALQLMKRKQGGEVFVKTSSTITTIAAVPMADVAECNAATFIQQLGHPCAAVTTEQGMCRCTESLDALYLGAENVTVNIDHSYELGVLKSEKQGARPTTHIRRSGSEEDMELFDHGEIISLPVYRWLQIAGVDLNVRNTHPAMAGHRPGDPTQVAYPLVRLTGITLQLSLKYYNFHYAPGDRSSPRVRCVLEVKPKYVWSTWGDVIVYDGEEASYPLSSDAAYMYTDVYDAGVKFVMQSTGMVGQFSLQALINAITQVLVLLATVNTVITLVATQPLLMGPRAVAYKSMRQERFSYEKEYAKYAMRAMTYMRTFDRLDEDNTGYLSRQELHKEVQKQFSEEMEEEDMQVLTEFCMQMADEHHDKVRKIGDGRITQREFVNICCSDASDVDSLVTLIQSIKPAKRQKFINRFNGHNAGKEAQYAKDEDEKDQGPEEVVVDAATEDVVLEDDKPASD